MVPLSDPAVELLKPLPQLGDYVFSTDGETHIKGFAKAKARLDSFLSAKDGPMEPWTFHDLRRTAATHMGRLGVSLEVIARVLNHARAGVTAKHYALYEYEAEKRSALDRWAAEVMRTVDGTAARKVVPIRG
jgi:integrase